MFAGASRPAELFHLAQLGDPTRTPDSSRDDVTVWLTQLSHLSEYVKPPQHVYNDRQSMFPGRTGPSPMLLIPRLPVDSVCLFVCVLPGGV